MAASTRVLCGGMGSLAGLGAGKQPGGSLGAVPLATGSLGPLPSTSNPPNMRARAHLPQSNLANRTLLKSSSAAILTTSGAIILQGPHHWV